MEDTSKLKKINKKNKWWSINNFGNKVQDNQLWKDLWDFFQVLQEVGLPDNVDQID